VAVDSEGNDEDIERLTVLKLLFISLAIFLMLQWITEVM